LIVIFKAPKSTKRLSLKESPPKTNRIFNIKIDMDSKFYNINLLEVILKWKLHIGIILLVALLASILFSSEMFIKPKYKSTALLYPSNVAPYSDESESEQVLEIFNSSDIRDKVIQKLELAQHYRISPKESLYLSYLYGEYSDNVMIKKTPNDAIEIVVLDESPDTAVLIVNAIIVFFNQKVENLHKEKYKEVYELYQRQIDRKLHFLDSLKAHYQTISKEYGLLDYEAQSRELTKGILRTSNGGRVDNKEVNVLKKNIEEKGAEMLLLKNMIENETSVYGKLSLEFDRARINYDRKYSHTSILSKPYAADKKSYPVRWLIVAISLLASFFFSVVLILILENYNRLKKD
jgi:capsular polysaccharide biosynthesis protein